MRGQGVDGCAESESEGWGGGEEGRAEAVSGWGWRRGGRDWVPREDEGGEETFVVSKREVGVRENFTITDQVEVVDGCKNVICDSASDASGCRADAGIGGGGGLRISAVKEGQRAVRCKI